MRRFVGPDGIVHVAEQAYWTICEYTRFVKPIPAPQLRDTKQHPTCIACIACMALPGRWRTSR